MSEPVSDRRDVYSVSRLNLEVRELLEAHFPPLWIEGEISNLARPRSGHIYFSLKDEGAQVRAAMFRMHNRRLEFEPEHGMQVTVYARVSLYPERGDFQLIVQHMEPAGAGALQRAFEALKRRLAAEGLFDAARKRPLPTLPRAIAVVTSPTGAALRDVLSTLKRRFASIPITVYPVAVQGDAAPGEIVAALERAGRDAVCDVLILTRGGGSLEDLSAFNDERVARAVAACPIPVVCGVGHETDFSIADFVADQRAATPTAAAELVSPDGVEWRARRDAAMRRLELLMIGRLADERQALEWLLRQLPHPRVRLAALAERRRSLLDRLRSASAAAIAERRQRLLALNGRLAHHTPQQRLGRARDRLHHLSERLDRAQASVLTQARQRCAELLRALEVLGPKSTLERGYAILTREDDASVVRSAEQVRSGDALRATLAVGRIRVSVTDRDDDI